MYETNKRFNIYDEYNADVKFFKLPKVFFTNPVYANMSNNAKVAWAILRDRLELSKKNKWFDEKGDIFFRYSNDELSTILNLSDRSVSRIRKELTESGLLVVEKRGLTLSDNLYLQYPIVTKNDIYLIDKQETVGTAPKDNEKENSARKIRNYKKKSTDTPNMAGQSKTYENNVLTDTPNMAGQSEAYENNVLTDTPYLTVQELPNWRTSDTYLIESETKETKETKETNKAPIYQCGNSINLEDHQLKDIFYKNHVNGYFDKVALGKIFLIAGNNISEAENLLKTANNAKRLFEKEIEPLFLDNNENNYLAINNTVKDKVFEDSLNQYIYAIKKGKIKSIGGYGRSVFLSAFCILAIFNVFNKRNEGYVSTEKATEKYNQITKFMKKEKLKNEFIDNQAQYLLKNYSLNIQKGNEMV